MHRTTNDRSHPRTFSSKRAKHWSSAVCWPIFMVGALFLATLACARSQTLRGLRSQSPTSQLTQTSSSVSPTRSATPSHTPTEFSTATQIPTPTPTPIVLTDLNVEQIQPLHILRGPTKGVTEVVISPDGKLVAASSLDGTVWLWQVSDGRLMHVFQGHTDSVLSLAVSPTGTLLASGSSDGTVKLWRIDDGGLVKTISGSFIGRVLRVAFSPDGSLFALADHQCFLQVRRTDTGLLWRTLAQPNCLALQEGTVSAWGLTFSPNGEYLLAGESRPCCGGSLQQWDVDDYQPPTTLLGFGLRFRDLAYSPDGSMLAVAFEGSSIFWLINASGGDLIRTFEGHSYQVNSVAFSPDGAFLVSGSADHKVRLWHVENGVWSHILVGHDAVVNSVAFSPDGSTIASGSEDGIVILWGILP